MDSRASAGDGATEDACPDPASGQTSSSIWDSTAHPNATQWQGAVPAERAVVSYDKQRVDCENPLG